MTNKYILITGGLGFIGSHCVVTLLEKNYEVIVIDNLVNSSIKVLDKIENITNKKPIFINIDITNKTDLFNSLKDYKNKITSCIHFAGYKTVAESMVNPMLYYNNNIIGSINILELLTYLECKHLVFSSSCTVYGSPRVNPIYEGNPTSFLNPYGCTKLVIEEIFESFCKSNMGKEYKIICLRYFNPIGAHPSGLLGEEPNNIPNNLMPFIMKVISNMENNLNLDNNTKLNDYNQVKIYGNDYNTPDGTCIRDYIHVMDLVDAHISALENVLNSNTYTTNFFKCNVGLGNGTSVLEMVNLTSKILGKNIPYKFYPKREGDCASIFADNTVCKKLLFFNPKYSVEDAIKHSIMFINKNK